MEKERELGIVFIELVEFATLPLQSHKSKLLRLRMKTYLLSAQVNNFIRKLDLPLRVTYLIKQWAIAF